MLNGLKTIALNADKCTDCKICELTCSAAKEGAFNPTKARLHIDRRGLLEVAGVACKALSGGRLLHWELGNEPDLYKTASQGHMRPPTWSESDYVTEWLNLTEEIKGAIADACPDLAQDSAFKFITPSFGGTNNSLSYNKTWADGLNTSTHIYQISSHNYIAGATQPGVTLAGTLMNHTRTRLSVDAQVVDGVLPPPQM